MSILINSKLKNIISGTETNGIILIHLNDINESFQFDSEKEAQDFLNEQSTERFGDKELRKGYFDYEDEVGEIHRYSIGGISRGKMTSCIETVLCKHTEGSLYENYGYLMDKEHGKDTELLLDIMRCNGIDVQEKDGYYLTLAE